MEITQRIRLETFEPLTLDSKGTPFYEFSVNPNSLSVDSSVKIVASEFLRKDGGIMRTTQRELRKISGNGKFIDIPEGSKDQFPLLGGNRTSSFDMYKDLITFMNSKQVLRFVHQYIGEIYIVIQSIKLTNTTSVNTLDFSFEFLETLLDTKSRTGFERDANQQITGMAVSSRNETTDTIQFKEYKVIQGDTLSKISQKFYGTSTKWTLIYDYNRSVLTQGPNILQIGTILKIPNASAPYQYSNGATPATKYSASNVPSSTPQAQTNDAQLVGNQWVCIDPAITANKNKQDAFDYYLNNNSQLSIDPALLPSAAELNSVTNSLTTAFKAVYKTTNTLKTGIQKQKTNWVSPFIIL